MTKVLVVDNDIFTHRIIQGKLKDYQLETSYVLTADEGSALMQSHHYDYVLIDHYMPGMDGLTLAKTMEGKLGNTKVYILTGADTKLVENLAIKTLAQIDGILSKDNMAEEFDKLFKQGGNHVSL